MQYIRSILLNQSFKKNESCSKLKIVIKKGPSDCFIACRERDIKRHGSFADHMEYIWQFQHKREHKNLENWVLRILIDLSEVLILKKTT